MPNSDSRLESIFMKLSRARDHFQSVATLNGEFESVECRMELTADPASGLSSLLVRLPEPPSELSAIVGDCLNNQRSSLDYLVWQIVESQPSEKPGRNNMFPICSSSEAYQNQIRAGRLRGVPDQAKAVIQELQPYEDQDHPLSLLQRLCNRDKHRDLNFAVAVASDVEVTFYRDGHPVFHTFIGNDEIANGEPFGDVGIPSSIAGALGNVQVLGRAKAFLAFEGHETRMGDARAVADTLREIQDLIEGPILDALSPFVRGNG